MIQDYDFVRTQEHMAKLRAGMEKDGMDLASKEPRVRINGLEPMDYDAPGTTTRESGV